MSGYPNSERAQSTAFDREIGLLLSGPTQLDVLALLRPALDALPEAWSRAIRSVRLGSVTRDRVTFEPAPIHAPNTEHERRFCALLLMILAECTGKTTGDVRAWTRRLWRGRQHRFELTPDGEFQRRYVRAVKDGKSGQQGGLAARLGCSVKEVERYLRVAIAAGFVSRWQVKARSEVEKLPKHLRGERWAYSALRWLGELPRQVLERIRERRRKVAKDARARNTPEPLASAPTPAAPDDGAAWLERVRTGDVGRSRAPE